MSERPLNDQQVKFCQIMVSGKPQTVAYQEAYNCENYDTAGANATRLLKDARVIEYVSQLRKERDDAAVLSIQQKREFLARVVNAKIGELTENDNLVQEVKIAPDGSISLKIPSKTEAIKIDNAMMGHDAPKQVKVDHTMTIGDIIKQVSGRDVSLLPTKEEKDQLKEIQE